MTAALILILLLAVNALFVAAEFGLVGARKSRIRTRAAAGEMLARRLLPLLENADLRDRAIGACQFGITVSSLALGAYCQQSLAGVFVPLFGSGVAAHSAAAAVVLLAITAIQAVVGEQTPKVLALQFPNRTALYTVLPVLWTMRLFGPFLRLLNGTGRAVLQLLRLPTTSRQHVHSPEEIKLLIAESGRSGVLASSDQQRLQQALNLSERRVRHLMVPRTQIDALDAEATAEEIIAAALATPFSRLPVQQGRIDRILGWVRVRDVLARDVTGEAVDLTTLLNPVTFVHEGMSAVQLLAHFRAHRSLLVLVTDDFGGVSGLVTLEDVLAEVLGDVGDEFRQADPVAEQLPDGRYRLAGSLRLSQMQAVLDLDLKGIYAATVGGFVLEVLGHMPVVNEAFEMAGFHFEVTEVADRVIVEVLVSLPSDPLDPEERQTPEPGEGPWRV